MRYILDKDGYIFHVSFGALIVCELGECTEYIGDVPDGYSSIEEWHEQEIERLNAWKIVDGNLVFDPNKCEILKTKCEKEHEDNRYVCHKEISNLTNLVKSDNANNYLTSISSLSNLIEATDSNKFASTYIKLLANKTISNKIHIKFNNGNLLTNDATSKTESGISFDVNSDRTITINGTATGNIEYDIGGTPNNTKPILAFKKGVNYYLSSNSYQIKMYNYDGVDREQIYSGTGGIINFADNDKLVTHIVLCIPNKKEVNETVKPMLNVGTTPKEYLTYEGNEAIVYLGENGFIPECELIINNGSIVYPENDFQLYYGLMPSETLTPSETLVPSDDVIIKSEQLDINNMPTTYLDLTYMYCMEDADLQVTYPNIQRNNDLTGYETPNGNFAIDEEGNMYCNNATIQGSAIVNGGNFRVDKDGNMTCGNAEIMGGSINLIDADREVNQSPMLNISGNIIVPYDIEFTDYYIKEYATSYLSNGVDVYCNDDGEENYASYKELGVDLETTENGETDRAYYRYNFMKLENDYDNRSVEITPTELEFKNTEDAADKIKIGNYGDDPFINVENSSNTSIIYPYGMWSASFNNNSLESKKKNISLNKGSLKEIIDSDIVDFNWKSEKDEVQKHVGLVIADEGGNYKTSSKVLTENKDAVDLYSMSSMAWKGIQELYEIIMNQQKQIEELTKELKKLKESDLNEEN